MLERLERVRTSTKKLALAKQKIELINFEMSMLHCFENSGMPKSKNYSNPLQQSLEKEQILANESLELLNERIRERLIIEKELFSKQLSNLEMQAVCLYYLHSCTYKEIAEALNTDQNNVGVHLQRARKKLQKESFVNRM